MFVIIITMYIFWQFERRHAVRDVQMKKKTSHIQKQNELRRLEPERD